MASTVNVVTIPDGVLEQAYAAIGVGKPFLSTTGKLYFKIDASTCLFPYNTWFIKGLYHADQPDDYHYKVLPAIAYGDLDINTDPEFPQYLISDGGQGIYAYTEVEEKNETFLYKVWMIIKQIILFPKTLWTKIFG